jgi:hypothetical protein
LTAAVQSLRNDDRLPHDPNRRESALTANRMGTSVIAVDMEPLITEHVLVRAPAQIRARLHGDVKIARVEVDKPEVIQLAEQSPREAVLVVGHAGVAIVKLWNHQDQVYTLHADVVQAPRAELAPEADARRAIVVAKGYAVARQPDDIPGRGEVVETLTRVKYKLSAGKAQALAAFLQQYGNDGVETKVEGETLTITASADAQARIGQFIQWLEPAPQRQPQPAIRQRSSNNPDPFSAPPVAAPPAPATTPGVDLGVLPSATPAPPPLGVNRAKPYRGAAPAR